MLILHKPDVAFANVWEIQRTSLAFHQSITSLLPRHDMNKQENRWSSCRLLKHCWTLCIHFRTTLCMLHFELHTNNSLT